MVKAIKYCNENYIEDPVEILKYLQSVLVTGRKLDIVDLTEALEGDTNYICVDRSNILETAFEKNKRLTGSTNDFGSSVLWRGLFIYKYEIKKYT